MNIDISQNRYELIKEFGYTIFRNAVDEKVINNLKLDLVSMSKISMRATTGDNTIDSNLILNPHSYSRNFHNIVTSKALIELLRPLLNDPFYRSIPPDLPNYCLNFSICRSSGYDPLDWHRDDRNPPSTHEEPCYVQLGLALDRSDESNGCTLIVPKSHRFNTYVKDVPDHEQIAVVLNPGDLIVYDGRLWHSAQPNISGNSRLIFFFAFARWHLRQTYDFPNNLKLDILQDLSLEEKLLMGFHAISKINPQNDITAGQRGDLAHMEIEYEKILFQKKLTS